MDSDKSDIERLYESLSALARRLSASLAEEMRTRGAVDAVELTIPLLLAGTPEKRRERAHEVLADLRQRLEEKLRTADAFRPGRVYCFWCETAGCEHAVPPTRKHIFAGFGPTGKPEWTEFHTLCLRAKDARVDGLFRDPPDVLGIVQHGHELTIGPPPDLPRAVHRYDVLGQVAAGYLPAGPGGEPGAITVQIVARYSEAGRTSLVLNAIGAFSLLATGVPEEGPEQDIEGILRATKERLARAEDHARMLESRPGPPPDLGKVIEPVLHRLRSSLERLSRRAERRTFHASMRHEEERPVGKALEDARTAGVDRFYADADEGTIVVLGPRNRVHVFTPSGRQVTSASYPPEAVERRVSQRRWRPMSREEVASFKKQVSVSP